MITRDFYVYGTLFTAVADGATVLNVFNIQSDADFEVEKLSAFTIDSQVITPIKTNMIVPRLTLQITETGSGVNMFSLPVPVGALFGSGEIPFILDTPRLFPARAAISVTTTSFDVMGNTNTMWLCFIGSKVYDSEKR